MTLPICIISKRLRAFSKLLLELGWPGHYLGAQGLSEVNPHLGEILGQGKLPEKRNQGSIQILHGTYKITEHRRASSIWKCTSLHTRGLLAYVEGQTDLALLSSQNLWLQASMPQDCSSRTRWNSFTMITMKTKKKSSFFASLQEGKNNKEDTIWMWKCGSTKGLLEHGMD